MTPRGARRASLVRAAAALLIAGCSAAAPPVRAPEPCAGPARSPATTPRRGRVAATPSATPRPTAPSTPRAPESTGPLIEGLTRLETDVLRETNRARQDPRGYADLLEQQLRHFDGTLLRIPGETPIRTREGARAVREAIRVLRGLKPIAPLVHAPGLSRAAREHVRDQGRRGATGHTGSDGSSAADRVSRQGRWDVSLGENIAYGPRTGRDVVIGLIVDDGVPDRGHRLTIFDPTLRVAGAACGEHRTYGMMCVMEYAGAFSEGRTAAR